MAGALVLGPAFTQGHAGAQEAAQQAAPKLTFEGDTALWTVAIKPDKTADFEKIIAKLHEGLNKSESAERRQQAVGWKVMKQAKPLQDGNIAYVHIINPVVPGADYTVMQALYDMFPDERQALYETYRGAFAATLGLAVGNMVQAPAAPAGHVQ
ncbi:MAG: hypothetical protein ACRD26_18665 [Vicinamibacterales bacterium]